MINQLSELNLDENWKLKKKRTKQDWSFEIVRIDYKLELFLERTNLPILKIPFNTYINHIIFAHFTVLHFEKGQF